MSEHKSPEQVDDEDFKIDATSADKNMINKTNKEKKLSGENYDLSQDK